MGVWCVWDAAVENLPFLLAIRQIEPNQRIHTKHLSN